MRQELGRTAPLLFSLLCVGCSGAASRATSAQQAAPASREGYISADGGVRLFYQLAGSGRDTIVVLHGGPGFNMSYLAADLEPLAARHVLLFYDQRGSCCSSSGSTGPECRAR